MCILADWDVVTIEKNSGVLIKSMDNAKNFLQQQEKTRSIHNLKRNILDSVKRQQQEIEVLYDYLTEMIDQIERYRSTNPFIPYEMVVTEERLIWIGLWGKWISGKNVRDGNRDPAKRGADDVSWAEGCIPQE